IETYCEFHKANASIENVLLSVQTLVKSELNINNFALKNIEIQNGKPQKVTVNIEELYYDYALTKQLDKLLEEKLSDTYCADFDVQLTKIDSKVDLEEILKTEPIKVVKKINKRLIHPIS